MRRPGAWWCHRSRSSPIVPCENTVRLTRRRQRLAELGDLGVTICHHRALRRGDEPRGGGGAPWGVCRVGRLSASATRACVTGPTIACAGLVRVARVACCPQVRRVGRNVWAPRGRDDLVNHGRVSGADSRRLDPALVTVALQDGRPDRVLPFPARGRSAGCCAFALPLRCDQGSNACS